MRQNLRRLFNKDISHVSKHHQKISKRCSYILGQLSPDGLIRWAQTCRPKDWQRCQNEQFWSSVRKVQQQEFRWSARMLEYLQELSEGDLKESEGFRSLYQGISHFYDCCFVN